EIAEKIKQELLLDKMDDAIQESMQATEHMRNIVHDLKGFARMGDDTLMAVDIHEAINMAIKMAYPITKTHAQIEQHFARNIPKLLFNSGKLHQVFLNLIVNAAQAIPEGKLSDNKIRIYTNLEDEFVRVDIIDTGTGIAPELLSKIFEPFFTTKKAGFGTGLGLTICREIVNKFDGEIKVKSVVGSGTTFSIYLPLKLKATEVTKDIQTKSIDAAEKIKKKVLLIDDEPLLLNGLERILESFHDITTAADGKKAINILEKEGFQFDVIVCDLNMPGVNGADVYHYVASHYPGREKDIIFASGGVYTQDLMDFIAKIDNKHLEKPFSSKQLLQLIDNFPHMRDKQ
ncbi:MAG: ATP-binding protein, partial [Gammaproteobacteria bacterium]